MDTQVADLLGGERVLGVSVKSNLDLARATRQGLPTETAVQLVVAIHGSDDAGNAAGSRRRRRGRAGAVVHGLEIEAGLIDVSAMGPLGDLIGSLRRTAKRRTEEAKITTSPARLTPKQSDIVIRTARALAKAIDVLGNREKAAHWLTTPNRALGGEIPIALLDTSSGEREVEAVLDRIEYGVYS